MWNATCAFWNWRKKDALPPVAKDRYGGCQHEEQLDFNVTKNQYKTKHTSPARAFAISLV